MNKKAFIKTKEDEEPQIIELGKNKRRLISRSNTKKRIVKRK
jgi:hypothetical protein